MYEYHNSATKGKEKEDGGGAEVEKKILWFKKMIRTSRKMNLKKFACYVQWVQCCSISITDKGYKSENLKISYSQIWLKYSMHIFSILDHFKAIKNIWNLSGF